MLCPEVWNFPPPKVMESKREHQDIESVQNTVNKNCFYKSLIITCPDEIQPPSSIQGMVSEDTDYYKLSECSLTEFVEPVFIESFVKNGTIYCLTADRNCIIQNCAAITPDGVLTLHILDYIYQTLGFEGTKRPHNYYEINIDLKTIKHKQKINSGLSKLELFDFYIIWKPNNEDICPSSIAKYFSDRDINVTVHSLSIKNISPDITEVPAIKDVDSDELAEWIGMLAQEAELDQKEAYISSYSQPESINALKTTRTSVYIVKGFIPSLLISSLCEELNEYIKSREMDNFWASISLQSDENSLWQWNKSSPKMFQAHDSSCTIFFTQQGHIEYSIGQLKYS
ncbi:ribonuclease P protein subunit p40-like [Anticarsia gemmatalis]|uniref:ribonuclease P protein subunit p40-like n=1 Tax=Anticarsia gemmatalis TaxID=129554 RepID=UPI003F765A93